MFKKNYSNRHSHHHNRNTRVLLKHIFRWQCSWCVHVDIHSWICIRYLAQTLCPLQQFCLRTENTVSCLVNLLVNKNPEHCRTEHMVDIDNRCHRTQGLFQHLLHDLEHTLLHSILAQTILLLAFQALDHKTMSKPIRVSSCLCFYWTLFNEQVDWCLILNSELDYLTIPEQPTQLTANSCGAGGLAMFHYSYDQKIFLILV